MSGDPKDEYLDASNNMRQFGNIRFAQLTLFVGMTAGAITVLFSSGSDLAESNFIFLTLGGAAVTVIFYWLDYRTMAYWNHFRVRAMELEVVLGFKQYTTAPVKSFFSATNAIRILFFGLFLFWLGLYILRPLH